MDINEPLLELSNIIIKDENDLILIFKKVIEIASYDNIEPYQILKLSKYNLFISENNEEELYSLILKMKKGYIEFSKIEKLYILVYIVNIICNIAKKYDLTKKDIFSSLNKNKTKEKLT